MTWIDAYMGHDTLYASENKRDTVGGSAPRGKEEGLADPPRKLASKNLSHRGARYAFPNVGIKVRVLLGLKSDISGQR